MHMKYQWLSGRRFDCARHIPKHGGVEVHDVGTPFLNRAHTGSDRVCFGTLNKPNTFLARPRRRYVLMGSAVPGSPIQRPIPIECQTPTDELDGTFHPSTG